MQLETSLSWPGSVSLVKMSISDMELASEHGIQNPLTLNAALPQPCLTDSVEENSAKRELTGFCRKSQEVTQCLNSVTLVDVGI